MEYDTALWILRLAVSRLKRKPPTLNGRTPIAIVLWLLPMIGCRTDSLPPEPDVDGDGWVSSADCDDTNAAVNPGHIEECDYLDNDCDGLIDDDDYDSRGILWYADADGDGYGDAAHTIGACNPVAGFVANPDDCDDTNPAISPAADPEGCLEEEDRNCDGELSRVDADGDGWAACEDCDDLDLSVHPGAHERCNSIDDDCDGLIDDGDPDVEDRPGWFVDADGDGYGAGASALRICVPPDGYSSNATDCDDTNPGVHPTAPEICDDLNTDEDCDGLVDDEDSVVDSTTFSRFYRDDDGDGYGDAADSGRQLCDPTTTRTVLSNNDCDDDDADVHPDLIEQCDPNDIDEDCDGLADDLDPVVDPSTYMTFYADSDGDGYGDPTNTSQACSPLGPTWLADARDCDDTDPTINPAAREICDSAETDEDCDGLADDADDTLDRRGLVAWFPDADADGYGNASQAGEVACHAPQAGWTNDRSDCDDENASVNPGQAELCDEDEVDEDCDDLVNDEDPGLDSSSASSWYPDADADGFGDASTTPTLACLAPVEGWIADGQDCDDANVAINPDATEICDSDDEDEDCDGQSDDDDTNTDLSTGTVWFADDDLDGFGDDDDSGTLACDPPDPTDVAIQGDCADTDSTIHPNADEICSDGLDNDCDPSPGGGGCALEGEVSMSTAMTTWVGPRSGDRLGCSVAPAGDPTGDGSPDILLGACHDATGGADAGAVWLVDSTGSGEVNVESVGWTFTGSETRDAAGTSVLGPGDLDGDGYDDIVIGAPNASGAVSEAGIVYVLRGPLTAGRALSSADLILEGSVSYDYVGKTVTSCDDMDGDGLMDLVLGAPGRDYTYESMGAAYLVSGASSGTVSLTTTTPQAMGPWFFDRTGGALAPGQDMDGDGVPDLIIGATGYDADTDEEGAAFVLTGPVSSARSIESYAWVISGVDFRDMTGSSLAVPGDVDGDGYADLLIGAWGLDAGGTTSGGAYFVRGPIAQDIALANADATLEGEWPTDAAGFAVAAPGDIDGDGAPDIAISAPGQDSAGDGSGRVYLLFGIPSGAVDLGTADTLIDGAQPYDAAGSAVAGAGDVDGDGRSDLLVGAPLADQGGSAAGVAALLLGGVP